MSEIGHTCTSIIKMGDAKIFLLQLMTFYRKKANVCWRVYVDHAPGSGQRSQTDTDSESWASVLGKALL